MVRSSVVMPARPFSISRQAHFHMALSPVESNWQAALLIMSMKFIADSKSPFPSWTEIVTMTLDSLLHYKSASQEIRLGRFEDANGWLRFAYANSTGF